MVNVSYKQIDDHIMFFEISGHAYFSNYGDDVVCSGISSVVFGTLNALVEFGLSDSRIIIDENFIRVNFDNNQDLQLICKTMLIQLKTIQESYPDYIEILKM